MENEQIEKLDSILRTIESTSMESEETGLPHDHIAEQFAKALDICQKADDKERARKFSWEYCLFSAVVPDIEHRKQWVHGIEPRVPFVDEACSDQTLFINDMLVYFKSRLSETQNVVLKAQYAHILWDRRAMSVFKGKENAEFAKTACKEYTNVAKQHFEVPDARFLVVYSLNRATGVALELGDRECTDYVIQSIVEVIKKWISLGQYKHTGTLAEIFLHVRETAGGKNLISNQFLLEVAQQLDLIIRHRGTLDELYFARHILEILARIHFSLGDNPKANMYKEEMAYTWIQQVDMTKPAKFLEASWLEEAVKTYHETGNKTMVGKIMKRIREANRESIARNEYGTVPVPYEIPVKKLEEIHSRYLEHANLFDCLRSIAQSDELIPSANNAVFRAKQSLSQNSLFNLINQSIIRGDRKAAEFRTPEQKVEHKTSQNLHLTTTGIIFFIVSPVLEKLKSEKGLNAETLLEFFRTWGQLDESILALMATGFERYFTNDYVSALYILTPTLERIIRELLMQSEVNVNPPKDGGYRESLLGTMLDKPEAEAVFGTAIKEYLKFVLINEETGGMNLRNDVAHALLDKENCTQQTADLLIFLYLVMTRFAPKKTTN